MMQDDHKEIWWMWMWWTVIYKINEMEKNDEMSELDFGIWNEWGERWCMRWMRWKSLGKYVTICTIFDCLNVYFQNI